MATKKTVTKKKVTPTPADKINLTVCIYGSSTKRVRVEKNKALSAIVEFISPPLAGKNYLIVANGAVVKGSSKASTYAGGKVVVVPPVKGSR